MVHVSYGLLLPPNIPTFCTCQILVWFFPPCFKKHRLNPTHVDLETTNKPCLWLSLSLSLFILIAVPGSEEEEQQNCVPY